MPSGGGLALTPDRRETLATGSRFEGIDTRGPVTEERVDDILSERKFLDAPSVANQSKIFWIDIRIIKLRYNN
jgi:hypothetical protein